MDTFTKTAVSQDIANSILKTMNVIAEICQKKNGTFYNVTINFKHILKGYTWKGNILASYDTKQH